MGSAESREEIGKERDAREAELSRDRARAEDAASKDPPTYAKEKEAYDRARASWGPDTTLKQVMDMCSGGALCEALIQNDNNRSINNAKSALDLFNKKLNSQTWDTTKTVSENLDANEALRKNFDSMLSSTARADFMKRATSPEARAWAKLLGKVIASGVAVTVAAIFAGNKIGDIERSLSTCQVQQPKQAVGALVCTFADDTAMQKAQEECTCMSAGTTTFQPCNRTVDDDHVSKNCPVLSARCNFPPNAGPCDPDHPNGGWNYIWHSCNWTCGLFHFVDDATRPTFNFLTWAFSHIGLVVTVIIALIVVPIFLSVFRTLNWKP